MRDWKDMVIDKHEELCFEFEEERGRAPTDSESAELWSNAEEYITDRQEAYADYMRKVAKGE